MRIDEYNDYIFADLENSNPGSWKNNSSLIYLSLMDQVVPTDSLVFVGGRPRTGKTSFMLDFIARNSLKPNPQNKVLQNEIMPRKGLVFFLGQKQNVVLQRWFSIVNQENARNFHGQTLPHLKDKYTDLLEGAELHFNFHDNTETLESVIKEEIEKTDPDYVIIDNINCDLNSNEYGLYYYGNDNDLLNGIIQLQKQTKKFFLITSTLGHDAWYRSGLKKHCLEDLHSILIEKNADMVLMLHRPDLFGIDVDEEGNSLKGIVEIDTVLNRLGREQISKRWKSIGDIPKLVK